MTFETKFNIGDDVYTLKDNKVFKFTICRILCGARSDSDGAWVNYSDDWVGDKRIFHEYDVFATKEELAQSLLK